MNRLIMIAAALLLLGSCSKDQQECDVGEASTLNLRFAVADNTPTSRSFFDGDPAGGAHEREISYIYAQIMQGSHTWSHMFTAEQIEAGGASLTLSLNRAMPVDVILMANFSPAQVSDLTPGSVEQARFREWILTYNNSIQSSGGEPFSFTSTLLPMTGSATATFAEGTYDCGVIELVRLVGKVEVKTTVSPEFALANGTASVWVNKVSLHDIPMYTDLVPWRTDFSNLRLYREDQRGYLADGYNATLFYVYEGMRELKLSLECTVDPDPDNGDVSDRFTVNYTAVFNRGGDVLLRNSYSRIALSITGVGEADIGGAFSVVPWSDLSSEHILE